MGHAASTVATQGLLAVDASTRPLKINFTIDNPFDPQALRMNPREMRFNDIDLVPDFSFAGAFASNRPLPDPYEEARIILAPGNNSSRDRTGDIQAAITKLSALGGGVIELAAGTYLLNSSESISFNTVNITLRGVLPSEDDDRPPTILRVAGPPRDVFAFGRDDLDSPIYSNTSTSPILEDYVPTGRTFVRVENARVFEPGQFIEIQRTISKEWVKALGMHKLYRDGETQTWIPPNTLYRQTRRVRTVDLEDNLVTFDVPLTDSLNNTLGAQGRVVAYTSPDNRTARCGLENFSVFMEEDQTGFAINSELRMRSLALFAAHSQDNWMRQIYTEGFNEVVNILSYASRITIQDVIMHRPSVTDSSAGFPAEISIAGSGVLVHRCATVGVPGSMSFSVVTQSLTAGPNVILEHRTQLPEHIVEPHARWSSGVLVDNSFVGGVVYRNRGTAGSGQGWSAAYSVAYNTVASGNINIQSPPLSFNIAVGLVGKIDPQSTLEAFVSPQAHVTPRSMFVQQLEDRIGAYRASLILPPAARAIERVADDTSSKLTPSISVGLKREQDTSSKLLPSISVGLKG